MLALLALVCGQALATTVVFDPTTDLGSQAGSSTGEDQVTKDGITISASPTGSFGNGQQYRVYKSSTFTISSTIGNITSVTFTCTAKDDAKYGPGCFTDCTTGSYTYSGNDGNWTGDASQISWTASSNQVRMTSITVVVGAPEPQQLSISGQTPFKGSTTVTITPSNPDFAVYYTIDGTHPVISSSSLQYTSPFTITKTTKVIAYEEDYDGNASDIVEKTFVKEEGGSGSGSGTLSDPFNAVAASELAASLEQGQVTDQDYYIKGKISQIKFTFNASYGTATFFISDDGSENDQFQIYATYFLENKPWVEGNTQIKLGDEVIICGKLTNYNGTPETASKQSYLYSLNGKTTDEPVIIEPDQPTGTGTLEDPFNYVAATNAAAALEQGTVTEQDYYIKGKISNIRFAYDEAHGTATFSISDNGTEAGQFLVYSTYFLENKPWVEGNTQINLGDEVIVCGKLTNYNGTPETASKQSYLYSLNGKTSEEPVIIEPAQPSGSGTLEDPYNSVAAYNIGAALEEGAVTEEGYYIKGKIASIANNGEFGERFGNASFYISDDGTDNGQFYIFRTLYLGNRKWVEGDTQIKVGDDVVVYGKITNYQGTTPETVQGETYLYSLNGKTADDPVEPAQPTGTGTLEDPFNYVAATNAAAALEQGTVSEQDYYIKGKISNIRFAYDEAHGTATFSISDNGTEAGQFLVYSTYFLENKPWVEGNTQINLGDEVIVCGKLTNYNGTPETASKQSYLYSLNGKTSEEPVIIEPAQPSGSGTLEDPYNSVAAYNIGAALEEGAVTEEGYYIKGKIASIANNGEFGERFGNASFYISDDGTDNGQFYIFRTLYLGNRKWVEGDTQIKVGDEVVVYGKITNYQGTTPETMQGETYLYSLNGVTDGIEEVTATAIDLNAPLYNVSGQRVDKTYKGIVIQNGKKHVLK